MSSVLDLVCSILGIDAMVDEVQIIDGAANVHRIGDDAFGGGTLSVHAETPNAHLAGLYT